MNRASQASVLAATIVCGCGGGGSSSDPGAALGSATLSWVAPTLNTDGTPIAGLSGFRIHYGISRQELQEVVEIDDPNMLTHTVEGLTAGTWLFEISAVDSAGVEGSPSNPASKTIN